MARRRKDQQQVSALLETMKQATGRGIRSPLYHWLRDHHDQIADALHRPRWVKVAAWLAGQDIRDGSGKPPSAAIARLTWRKVRADLATARAAPVAQPPSPAPDEIAPGVRAILPTAAGTSGAARTRMALDIRPARARADISIPDATPAAPPATADPTVAGQTAAEQLENVFAAMAAGTTPMPKIVR
jgi:hypothetical protein